MNKRHTKYLDQIKDQIKTSADGAKLMNFAEKNKVSIKFKIMHHRLHGLYDRETKQITLNALYAFPLVFNKLISALVHELRHFWQDCLLDFSKETLLTPIDRIIFEKATEADAFAFQNKVLEEIKSANRVERNHRHTSRTPEQQMEKDFKDFQTGPASRFYEDSALFEIKRNAKRKKNNERLLSQSIRQTFNDESLKTFISSHSDRGFNYLDAPTIDSFILQMENLISDISLKKCKKLKV